ncbi:hypothetical protein BH23ACT11_BH23ACT11_05020 [soil metagenome]
MTTSELQILPENFNISSEKPEDSLLMLTESLPLEDRPTHLESTVPEDLARRVIAQMAPLAPVTNIQLTVEGEDVSSSLVLPLRISIRPQSIKLFTPDSAEGIEFALKIGTHRQGQLDLNVRYAGLPLDKALSYASFVSALHSSKGALYIAEPQQNSERFELFRLPLPLDNSRKSESEDMVRFLEALREVSEATGTKLVYPAEVKDEDLRKLNHILGAIRGGWVALPVIDFTTPLERDGIKNVLNLVAQEGEVLKSLAMTAEWERVKIFNAWVNLGPSIRYVSGARLLTPRSEMEQWLDSGPADESFDVRWKPVEEARVHVFYNEWPKPSLRATREDIKAFEEETGRTSEEFRAAWDAGEAWTQEVEDGDIWLSLLDAERHLLARTS